MPTPHEAAREFLHQGRSVIPVKGKIPLVSWDHYQSHYATDEQVDAWWAQWPDAGVGIVTGAISNLVVLDIDTKGATSSIVDAHSWVREHGLTPTTLVRTPSGGLHLYYAHPRVRVQNTTRCAVVDGFPCDIRGDGGFVVAPPSPGYALERPYLAPVAWPGAPAGAVPPRPTTLADLTIQGGVEELFRPAPEGERNQSAARLAGYLLKVSDEQAAWVQLSQWNARNLPPLDERELRRTFESIAAREARFAHESPSPAQESAPRSLDILSGADWADAVEFAPERSGLRLETLPIADSFRGFCPGDLALLAARPGTGKSTLVWGMAWELAITQRVPTLLCSGEMSPADVARWMTHFRTGLGYITPEDWRETMTLLRQAPISIINRGIFTPALVAEAMDAMSPQFVIIDHIQRMRLARAESRNHELEQCAAELKGMAMQRQAVMFALCQLNRLAENVEHPTIAHLRDSGGLEQEADTVLGLSHVGDRLQQDPMRATVRVATIKSRHGPENLEQLAWFHKATKRFEWLRTDVNWRDVR